MACWTCLHIPRELPPFRLYLDARNRHVLADVRCPDCEETFIRTAQPHPLMIRTTAPDCPACMDRLAAHPDLADGIVVTWWGGVRGDDFSYL